MIIEISDKIYERKLSWDDGNMYCQLLVIDGKNDWRMPTLAELKEIYNSENDLVGYYYWSSTENGEAYAWLQIMFSCEHGSDYKTHCHNVRAVRTI